jgi:hypothetical protein
MRMRARKHLASELRMSGCHAVCEPMNPGQLLRCRLWLQHCVRLHVFYYAAELDRAPLTT